jgi:hypothetical protein
MAPFKQPGFHMEKPLSPRDSLIKNLAANPEVQEAAFAIIDTAMRESLSHANQQKSDLDKQPAINVLKSKLKDHKVDPEIINIEAMNDDQIEEVAREIFMSGAKNEDDDDD